MRFACERIESMKTQITIWQYHCDKCFHVWQKQTNNDNEPRLCPKCKTVKWNDDNRGVEAVEIAKPILTAKQTPKHAQIASKAQETVYQETSIVYDTDASNDYAE